ncbi:ribosomal protein, partial [Mycena albidolilacea]
NMRVHGKDKDSKFCVILIKARIHRLLRCDKTKQQIPPTFKYNFFTAWHSA